MCPRIADVAMCEEKPVRQILVVRGWTQGFFGVTWPRRRVAVRDAELENPERNVCTIFGTLDLVTAITLATIHNAPAAMGPAYWIPAFWVPLLLVTHYITFIVLWKHWNRAS